MRKCFGVKKPTGIIKLFGFTDGFFEWFSLINNNGDFFSTGWSVVCAFYAPVACLIIINLVFYWQSQQRITKQLIYNRGMQHFQVK